VTALRIEQLSVFFTAKAVAGTQAFLTKVFGLSQPSATHVSRKWLEIEAQFQRPSIGNGIWQIEWSRDR